MSPPSTLAGVTDRNALYYGDNLDMTERFSRLDDWRIASNGTCLMINMPARGGRLEVLACR